MADFNWVFLQDFVGARHAVALKYSLSPNASIRSLLEPIRKADFRDFNRR